MFLALFTFTAMAFSAFAEPAKVDDGYIRDWWVIGPTDRIDVNSELAALNNIYAMANPVEGAEMTFPSGKKLTWKKIHCEGPVLDFSAFLNADMNCSAIAIARIQCDRDMEVRITGSTDCAYVISSNAVASRVPDIAKRFRMDATAVQFAFKAGINRVTLILAPQRNRSKGLLSFRTNDPGSESTRTQEITGEIMDATEFKGVFLRPNRVSVREGDDPGWSDPALDDSTWKRQFFPGIEDYKSGSVRQPTTIWYRFKILIGDDLIGRPVVLECYPFLTTLEVFLDGQKVKPPYHASTPWRTIPEPMTFTKKEVDVALRWPITPLIVRHQTLDNGYFALLVRDYEKALEEYHVGVTVEGGYELHRYALMAFFAATLLFHIVLYYSHRRRRENLFVAATMAMALLSVVALHVSDLADDQIVWYYAYKHAFLGFSTLCIALSVGLLQLAVAGRFSRWFYLYLGLGVVCLIAGIHYDARYAKLFPIFCAPEALRILYEAARKKRFGTRRLALVTILLLVVVGLTSVGSVVNWPESSGFMRYASWYGFAAFTQVILFLMAREFGTSIAKVQQFTLTLEGLVAQRTQELKEEIDVRKRTQADLSRSLSVLHTTIETTVGGIAVIDETRKVILCNAKFSALWGIEDTWPGLPTQEERCNVMAQQTSDPGTAAAGLDALFQISDASRTETMVLKNGRMLVCSGHPYRFEGKVAGRLFVCQDDTERLQHSAVRDKLVRDLREALAEVRTLHGLLPICASCKRIRDDLGYWNQIEYYVSVRTEAQFSHGICPECMKKLYSAYASDVDDDDSPVCTCDDE